MLPQLAVSMRLGTDFIDCFIRGMFPSEGEVISWHWPPVAIRTNPKPGYNVNNTHKDHRNHEPIEHEAKKTPTIRVAKRIVIKRRTNTT